MKHTKGPWSLVKRDLDRQVNPTTRKPVYTIDNDEGVTIAELGAGINNAALIAAAPELLEALIKIHSCVVFNNGPEIHLGLAELKLISSAIAKAQGGVE